MKFNHFAAAAALAIAGFSVSATAQIAVGAKIYGPQGEEVGTVEQVDGGNVVVNTGTLTATLPQDVFGEGETGPTIGWNKAELEAAISAAEQEASAELDTALVAGAQLYSVDGVAVGSVESVGADGMVVVEHASAGSIQLPKDQMAMQNGQLTFLATAADLEAAVSAQTGG